MNGIDKDLVMFMSWLPFFEEKNLGVTSKIITLYFICFKPACEIQAMASDQNFVELSQNNYHPLVKKISNIYYTTQTKISKEILS